MLCLLLIERKKKRGGEEIEKRPGGFFPRAEMP
jgi:hypothetical protein